MNPQSEKKMANGDRLAEMMTKREAFAMAAMQGFAASAVSSTVPHKQLIEASVMWADALLAEMEKRNG